MDYLNHQDIQGIKLQLLHVLKNTDLAADYLEGKFSVYTMEEYLDLLIDCLEHLSPDIVIHRLTGGRSERSVDCSFVEQQETYGFKYPAP